MMVPSGNDDPGKGLMDFEQFQREYAAARADVEAGRITDVAAVRSRLEDFAAELGTPTDREVARGLIGRLAAPAAVRQSAEMQEALRLLADTDFTTGTADERLAALAAVRREIWAIADRAGTDSAAIRGLTRGLESSENHLNDPPWDDPQPAGA